MISILNESIYDQFMHLVGDAEKDIKLCAPFIKTSIVNDIVSYKKHNVSVSAITNVQLMSFYRKALDVDALSKILHTNGNVYNYPSLHVKIYIFDEKKLIITSANLTESGLKRNREYGIITDNIDLVQTAKNDFNLMCIDNKAAKVTTEHLSDIESIINSIPNEVRIRLPRYEIENETYEIYSYDIIQSSSNFSGWKKDVYDIIVEFPEDYFELKDFNNHLPKLKILHPDNNNIEAKIRQILQQLRDLGLIKFEGNGLYMRLFK